MAASDDLSITPLPSAHRQHTFRVHFAGDTLIVTITRRPANVRRWIYHIRNVYRRNLSNRDLVVGLAAQGEPSHDPIQICTLHLCVGSRCLILQLARARSIPNVLRNFLQDESITFYGFQVARNSLLLTENHGMEVRNQRELTLSPRNPTIAGTAQELLLINAEIVRIAMRDEIGLLTNWEGAYLSDNQILYAAVGAFLSFSLAFAPQVENLEM